MSLDSINETLSGITGRQKSIAQNLQALIEDIRGSYAVVAERGGTIPEQTNTENLPESIASLVEES